MRFFYAAMAISMMVASWILYVRAGYLIVAGGNPLWQVLVTLGAGSGFSALCAEYISKAKGKGSPVQDLGKEVED